MAITLDYRPVVIEVTVTGDVIIPLQFSIPPGLSSVVAEYLKPDNTWESIPIESYQVTTGFSGGSVKILSLFNDTLPKPAKYQVSRVTPKHQPTVFNDRQQIPSKSLEEALDNLEVQIQEVAASGLSIDSLTPVTNELQQAINAEAQARAAGDAGLAAALSQHEWVVANDVEPGHVIVGEGLQSNIVTGFLDVKFGSISGTVCAGDDPRLTTPALHAPTHAFGGTDPVTPEAIHAATANHTHLVATDTRLGFVKPDGVTITVDAYGTITSIGGGGGGNGVSIHNQLSGRDALNAHPVAAITGLQSTLNTIPATKYPITSPGGDAVPTEKAVVEYVSLQFAQTSATLGNAVYYPISATALSTVQPTSTIIIPISLDATAPKTLTMTGAFTEAGSFNPNASYTIVRYFMGLASGVAYTVKIVYYVKGIEIFNETRTFTPNAATHTLQIFIPPQSTYPDYIPWTTGDVFMEVLTMSKATGSATTTVNLIQEPTTGLLSYTFRQGGSILAKDVVYNDTTVKVALDLLSQSSDGAYVGEFRLFPFSAAELPAKWYLADGVTFNVTTPQGIVLKSLSADYKTRWRVVESSGIINTPTLYHTDGRGLFLRPSTAVGVTIADGIRNISGASGSIYALGNNSGSTASTSPIRLVDTGAAIAVGATAVTLYWKYNTFDASSVVPTANENRPLHVGVTPAVYLGV